MAANAFYILGRRHTFGPNGSIIVPFGVTGTNDDVEAHDAMLAFAPLTYLELPRQNSELDEVAEDYYEGAVIYGPNEPREVGSSQFQFDTGGGTQRITQSLGTRRYGTNTPDFKGAIGVTKDSVQGVDITVPVYNFAETHILSADIVTESYKLTLYNLTGKVNTDSFRGKAPGEVLFLGASGSTRDAQSWEVTFRFAGSPNKTGLTVGDITDIEKKGWEYLWVLYEDQEDDTANRLVKRPIAVYVEQVFYTDSFAGLGI